jgi:dTDP-4-dehydrorhamnose reductase
VNILILGALGQVGWDLQTTLQGLGEIHAWDLPDLDLNDSDLMRRKILDLKPGAIVNAAAYTNVDGCEDHQAAAERINAGVPGELAALCAEMDALFIHYSTDYVFDGAAHAPYREDDPAGPLGAYGRTKLAGERAVTSAGGWSRTLRTSWVYSARARNFLRTIVTHAAAGKPLRVVSDQHGVPTWSTWLALATGQIVRTELVAPRRRPELYHVTGTGPTTWWEFTAAILEELRPAGLEAPPPVPIPTGEFPTKTRRPMYSVLSCDKLERDYGLRPPHWRESLRLALRGQRVADLVYSETKR